MAGTVRRRGVAVTALALVSGASLTLAAATPAGAVQTHAPAYYQGVTSANVLSVALNLPSALPALPGIPKNLVLNLMSVDGSATHNTLATGDKTASKAVAAFASGSLVDSLPSAVRSALNLDKTVTATLGMKPQAWHDFAVNASPLLNLNVGPLAASALQGVNSSHSELLNGTVAELGQLLNLKTAAGVNLLGSLEKNVNNVSNTVTTEVGSVLDTIGQALNQQNLTNTAKKELKTLQSTLQTVQDKVNAILNGVAKTSVLSLDTLDATQSIAPAVVNRANAAVANAAVHVANINVLNGLLTVKGFVSQATASATGAKGGLTATPSGHAPIVQVGTPLLTATLDENGLQITKVVQGLPQQVQDAVNQALSTLQGALNTLLGTLGVHLDYVKGTSSTSNGVAKAVGPWYRIAVDSPLDKGSELLEVGLGHGTTASISAAQAPRLVKLRNPQQGALPHTGANLPLIGGAGLALFLGAAVLRRRFAA